jgi:hypothetical protein
MTVKYRFHRNPQLKTTRQCNVMEHSTLQCSAKPLPKRNSVRPNYSRPWNIGSALRKLDSGSRGSAPCLIPSGYASRNLIAAEMEEPRRFSVSVSVVLMLCWYWFWSASSWMLVVCPCVTCNAGPDVTRDSNEPPVA